MLIIHIHIIVFFICCYLAPFSEKDHDHAEDITFSGIYIFAYFTPLWLATQ